MSRRRTEIAPSLSGEIAPGELVNVLEHIPVDGTRALRRDLDEPLDRRVALVLFALHGLCAFDREVVEDPGRRRSAEVTLDARVRVGELRVVRDGDAAVAGGHRQSVTLRCYTSSDGNGANVPSARCGLFDPALEGAGPDFCTLDPYRFTTYGGGMAETVTSLVQQFAAMKPNEFSPAIEPKWKVAERLVTEVRGSVEKKQLTPLDGARVISSITATLFGYDEFILREVSPETFLAASAARR